VAATNEAADLTYRLRSADPDTARYEERIVLHELTQCGLVPPGWLGRGADDLRWRAALDRRQKRGRSAVPGVGPGEVRGGGGNGEHS